MPKPPDRVVVIKQESLSTGGDPLDADSMLNQPLDASEDSINVAGVSFQEPTGGGANSNDDTTVIYRENGKMFFEDTENSAAGRVCLTEIAKKATQCGQVLVAVTDTEFQAVMPILGPSGWLTSGGRMLVK